MNKFFRVFLPFLILLLALPSFPAAADGNGRLRVSLLTSLNGGVTAAGAGLRGTGSGEIEITGIPAGAQVSRAWLYWATLGNANTFTSPSLEGVSVAGDVIGVSGDTCWGVQQNVVYRADVTALISGNGSYTISGLPASLGGGNDSQGASLVVIYEASSLPLRTIVIHDGAVSLNFTNQDYSHIIGGFAPDSPLTEARVTYLIGDGQEQWEAGNVSFNGEPLASGVFSGLEGDFWGTHSFDVTGLVEGAPATTRISNLDPDNPDSPDCLLWAGTIFSVTAGEPAQAENRLTEFLNFSLRGDVTASGVGLRGRGEGEIQVSGIPARALVTRAYLYWATLGTSGGFTEVVLDGEPVNGALTGVSADTCWGAQNNYVYRAEVTDIVRENGSYYVSGLPDNLAAGNDSQGASLVILYRDLGLYRTVIINDGAVTLDLDVHEYTDTLGDFTADQPEARAHVTYLIGDGQERWDSGSVLFEGVPIGSNVFNGEDGNYWGTIRFDVTGLIVEPEATTTISNLNPNTPGDPDCLLWAATILAVETEPPVYTDFLYFPWMMVGEEEG